MRRVRLTLLRLWRGVISTKPQTAVAMLCLCIVVARFIWPDLKFDSLSLNLILVAMLCILIPDLAHLIARIRKIKVGDKEVELGEAIDSLVKQTKDIEDRVSSSPEDVYVRTNDLPPHIARYIRDPRGGLIAIAADIEGRVQNLMKQSNLPDSLRYITPTRGVEALAKRGLVVPELPSLMRDFWVVRNNAVHASESRMTEHDIYRLVDLGVRILELLSIRKRE